MLKVAMQAAGCENTSVILPSIDSYILQFQPARKDVPTGAIEVTSHFLIEFEARSIEGNSGWYCKHGPQLGKS